MVGSSRNRSTNPAGPSEPENRGRGQVGTLPAIYTNARSCERIATRGGARNRADRASDGLTDKQVDKLLGASRYALATGRAFQRHWIIHYGKAGIAPEDATRFISRLLDLASKQARREGGRLAAIWVRENASDKGEHVHILLHLPAAMRLHGRTRRWIEAAGGKWHRGISKVRIVAGCLPKVRMNTDSHHAANATNVLRYLLKGASAEMGEKLDLKRAGCDGRIVGKRCGWTQNIGVSAKAKGEKVSATDEGE